MRALVLLSAFAIGGVCEAASAGDFAPGPGGGFLAVFGTPGDPGPGATAVAPPVEELTEPVLPSPRAGAGLVFQILILAAGAASAAVLWRRGLLRRGGLSPLRRDPGGMRAPVWGAIAIGLFLVPVVGVSVAGAMLNITSSGAPDLRQVAIVSLSGYAPTLVVIGVAFALAGTALRRAGFAMGPADALRGLGALLVALPLVLAANIVTAWAAKLLGAPPSDVFAHATLRQLVDGPRDGWWWATVAAVVVGAPIVEEFIYRGFLQTALLRAAGSPWVAILTTSAVFTLAHIGAADWHALPGLFALSVGLGAAMERWGRIGAPIVMHMGFNALNITLAMAAV